MLKTTAAPLSTEHAQYKSGL